VNMKKWETINKLKTQNAKLKIDELIDLLLENRGITTKKEREAFLHPKLEDVTPKSVGIDAKQLKQAIARIKQAIEKKEQIIVFGDYDVDGITGSAILWETLHSMGADVWPYIPSRVEEGYGLSVKALENQALRAKHPTLIITTDNGIVAHDAVKFANEQGIDVIITDHHVPPAGGDAKLPEAYAIVHTTKLCGAGVAYVLSKEINNVILGRRDDDSRIAKVTAVRDSGRTSFARMTEEEDNHLELATLGTVADMVPLTGANRAIVKNGLPVLSQTKRRGLLALFKQAGLQQETFSVYEIGYIIAPRLNASGRIASAMDSLRLLCTTNTKRAEALAELLEATNKERQVLLREAAEDAVLRVKQQAASSKKLVIVAQESYQEGVIGLVAGKLVEAFYRPAIVIAKREKISKASVRSVSGFNVIEFLRIHAAHFVNVGGHPMAAGFTIETEKIIMLQQLLEEQAEKMLDEATLTRKLKIDCELSLSMITEKLYEALQVLAPFGMGNPEPVFATRDVIIQDIRVMGKEGSHLKLFLRQEKDSFEAIAFGMGERASELHVGDTIDVAYTIDENTWNGNTKLQLKVKDIVKQAQAV